MIKVWIGKWIMTVATLHSIFGLWKYSSQFKDMISQGFWASANTAEHKLAVWFVLFGIAFFVLGQYIHQRESASENPLITSAILLLLVVTSGVILIPVSGFWLLLPPVITLFINRMRTNK